jgi:DNA repair exonuclease SbcCD nuclease subunit
MPRLLHLADVHLGARHGDLGPVAAAQRERQFAAFHRAIDLALAERVDLILICGDLFDSNQQPRRSVERAAAEIHRAVEVGIATIVIPGTHDAYDAGSLYRVHDLPRLAGSPEGSDLAVVLTPERPSVSYGQLDVTVHGRVFATKRGPRSPLAGFRAAGPDEAARACRWQVGMIHGSLRIAGRVEDDDVLFTTEEIVASGLDYLALGHWHSHQQGVAGATTWAYAGAPEPVAVDQDGAGQVLLVDLHEVDGRKAVDIVVRQVGQTRFLALDIDASEVDSQPALIERILAHRDPDLVVDIRLLGVLPDGLDVNEDEVERALDGAFFGRRFRVRAVPPVADGEIPPPDTIPGAFILDLQARIAEAEAAGRTDEALELRESLRLGRLLLLGDPASVTLV